MSFSDADLDKLYASCKKKKGKAGYPELKKWVAECKRIVATGKADKKLNAFLLLQDALHNIDLQDKFNNSFLGVTYNKDGTYERRFFIDKTPWTDSVYNINVAGFITVTRPREETYFYSNDVNDVVLLDHVIQLGDNVDENKALSNIIQEALKRVGATLNNPETAEFRKLTFEDDIYETAKKLQSNSKYEKVSGTGTGQSKYDSSDESEPEDPQPSSSDESDPDVKPKKNPKKDPKKDPTREPEKNRKGTMSLILSALQTEELDEKGKPRSTRTPIYKDVQYDPDAEFDKYVRMARRYMQKQGNDKDESLDKYNMKCAKILSHRMDYIYASLSEEARLANTEKMEKARQAIGKDDPFLNFVPLWYGMNDVAGSTQTAYPAFPRVTESRFPQNLLTSKMKTAYPMVSTVEDFWNGLKVKYTEERRKEVKELVDYLQKKQRSFHKI